MTENEIKIKLEVLKDWVGNVSLTRQDMQNVIDEAIKAIDELQQYRAIGTVEGYENAIKAYTETYILMKEHKSKLQEYQSIGTVQKCKMAMQKCYAKKRTILHGNYYCCECGKLAEESGHCRFCGQSLY